MSAAAAHAPYPLDQEVEWLGLRFRVPRDWEMVRHGLLPEQGSLVWIDRRSQRLTVSWTQCRAQPDIDRLLSDYQSKQRQQTGASGYREFHSGAYRGFSHQGPEGERVTRALRYFGRQARLVEVLFVERSGQDEPALLRALLESLELVARADEARRVRAFDVDVSAPEGFRFARADVKPLDVTLHFAERKGVATASLRRLGMASSWRRGELCTAIEKHWPKARLALEPTQDALRVSLSGYEPGPIYLRWLGRLRRQRTVAWEVPAEDAVYELTTHSLDARPVAPSAFSVRGLKEASSCE